MQRVSLSLKKQLDDSYDILLERGLLKKVGSLIRMLNAAENYVLITDTTVNRHYGSTMVDQLKKADIYLGKIVVPAGEESKTLQQMQEVLEKMVELGAHRKTAVIALGGGVVGDLAGFVAASFQRGVPYVQVPTTLLAMVDSSVGGKVAVDLPSGKNLVGAFWQPKAVLIDPEVLKTLAQKQWRAGLGEAVKYGAIADRSLWEFFEDQVLVLNKQAEQWVPSEWKIVEEMILRCIQIKSDVVMKDEKEGNYRQILNYGHTFGHVVELMSGYKTLHGEAVALGMKMAADLAVEMRLMRSEERDRQEALLKTLGIGKGKVKGLIKEFVQHMKKDKKAREDIRVVLVDRLGRCAQKLGRYALEADEKQLKAVLKSYVTDEKIEEAVKPVSRVASYSSSSISSPAVGTSYQTPSYSSPSLSSHPEATQETDLQRRLRLMRERRAQEGSSGLSGGGFLPG